MNQNLTSTSALLRIYRREKGLSSISWGRSHLQTPSTYLFNQSYFNQTQLHRGGKDSSNSYASIRECRIGLTRISHNVSGLTYAFSFIYYAFELKGESESMKKKYIHVNTAKLRVNLQHLKALTPEEAVVTL